MHIDHDRQFALFESDGSIDIGHHIRITQRQRPAGAKFHFLPQAHVLIGRFRRPIDKRNGQFIFVGRQHFDISTLLPDSPLAE